MAEVTSLAAGTVLIAKNGQQRRIADSGTPSRDKAGQVIGFVLVFRDISHQLRTEQELLKVKKLESVGVLAGGIAHDFNNLVINFTQPLQAKPLATEKFRGKQRLSPATYDSLCPSLNFSVADYVFSGVK